MAGFQAQIGIPDMPDFSQLPNIIELGTDASAVTYNMFCKTFVVVELVPAGGYHKTLTWTFCSQADDPAPWVFASRVNLAASVVDPDYYKDLPPDVRTEQELLYSQDNMTFSIQQLYLDLNNTTLMSIPIINGPGATANNLLNTYFIHEYFNAMKAAGSPLIHMTITNKVAPTTSLTLTSYELEVDTYHDFNIPSGKTAEKLDLADLSTLNYICTVDGKVPKQLNHFGWNWIDSTDIDNYSGVVSINRDTLMSFFKNQLDSYVPSVCFAPAALIAWKNDGGKIYLDYSANFADGQDPKRVETKVSEFPTTGNVVLWYSYNASSSDRAGLEGALGELTISTSYTMSLEFVGTKMIITQKEVVAVYIRYLASPLSGNMVDKTVINTYDIAVDNYGKLLVKEEDPVINDTSYFPPANPFIQAFTNIDAITAKIKSSTTGIASRDLTTIPLAVVRSFIFPGGTAFIYKNAHFSDNLDLVSLITYAETDAPAADPSAPKPKGKKYVALVPPTHWAGDGTGRNRKSVLSTEPEKVAVKPSKTKPSKTKPFAQTPKKNPLPLTKGSHAGYTNGAPVTQMRVPVGRF
jgi:hypothetical protein